MASSIIVLSVLYVEFWSTSSTLEETSETDSQGTRRNSMITCMANHVYCSRGMDQSGKVANPAYYGQLSRENEHFRVPVRA